MRINIYETFCQVVEEGSISKVAKNNYMTQPAITNRIKQLEKLYGVMLFDRQNGNLHINRHGRQLFKQAKRIINEYHQSFDLINDLKVKENNYLKIGATFLIGEYLIPRYLGALKKIYPDAKIRLEINRTPKILQKLKEKKIDIALVQGELDDPQELIVKRFAEERLVFVCSPKYLRVNKDKVLSLNDLASERFIWREKNSRTRTYIEKKLRSKRMLNNINIYMELGSSRAVKEAVSANIGIAILSELIVEKELEKGILKKLNINGIEEIDLKRDMWIVKRRSKVKNDIEKEFTQLLLNGIKQRVVY